MNEHAVKPRPIDPPSALVPHWNWNRAIPQPGHMAVDFEGRVDFRRMHAYRLERARRALANSKLGALLTFDVNNIRYLTSTKIGDQDRRMGAGQADL